MKNINEFEKLIKKNIEKFDIYYQNLISYNEKVNLTAITEKEDVYIKHFLDSILGEDIIPENASVIDVGTGAGFPGLPLKIVRDDINLTLVDSLNKRLEFLSQLVTDLGYECNFINENTIQKNIKNLKEQLKNDIKLEKFNLISENKKIINIVHSRAEDFCKFARESFDVAVARAVAKLNTLVEYLLPLIKVGGILIAYKGSNSIEELTEAKKAIEILGGKFENSIEYVLPKDKGIRNILIIRKIKSTPNLYPRDKNLPKLKPIV